MATYRGLLLLLLTGIPTLLLAEFTYPLQAQKVADNVYAVITPTRELPNEINGGWRRPDGSADGGKYVVPPSGQNFFERLKAAALILNNTDAIIAGTEFGGFDTHSQQGGITGRHSDLNRQIGWAIYGLRKYFTR